MNGRPIDPLLDQGERLVLAFACPHGTPRHQALPGWKAEAERAFREKVRSDFALAYDSRDAVRTRDELQGAVKELQLAEAMLAEARARNARVSIDPDAGAGAAAEAENALAASEQRLARAARRLDELDEEVLARGDAADTESNRAAHDEADKTKARLRAELLELLRQIAAKASPELAKLDRVAALLHQVDWAGLAGQVAAELQDTEKVGTAITESLQRTRAREEEKAEKALEQDRSRLGQEARLFGTAKGERRPPL
jgi:hypothetical protein